MSRIEPAWVGELLGQWAANDWRNAQQDLGFPSVSPMFARAVGTSFELEDVTGFSRAEFRAMVAAVDWLHLNHPDHCVQHLPRPRWRQGGFQRMSGCLRR